MKPKTRALDAGRGRLHGDAAQACGCGCGPREQEGGARCGGKPQRSSRFFGGHTGVGERGMAGSQNIWADRNWHFRFPSRAPDMTQRATVREVARDLGLSPRRVHQLVDENVLPPATEGTFDADLCRRRYGLFTRGASADWTHIYDDAVVLAKTSEDCVDRALGPTGTVVDIARACESVSALMSDLRFISAVKSNSQSERQLFLATWDREEARILGALLARAQILSAGTAV